MTSENFPLLIKRPINVDNIVIDFFVDFVIEILE